MQKKLANSISLTMPSLSFVQIPLLLTMLCSSANLVASQQAYASSSCSNSTSASGYACNGLNKRCQTYLIFRVQPPYNNASSIATLLGSDPSQITKINNISDSDVLVTRKEVIVPINCSCSGSYYQSNTSYVVQAGGTPYLIANNTFEGLTTCTAIQSQRSGLIVDMFPDERLVIPLRCACPTKNQSDLGIKYLITYVIKSGDAISTISLKFHGDVGETLQANQKSDEDSVILPFTTLLVPLRNPPNSSMTYTPSITPPSSSSSSPPPSSPAAVSQTSAAKKWNYFVYGLIAGGGFMLILGAVAVCLLTQRFKKRAEPPSRKMASSQEEPVERKSAVDADFEPLKFMDSISSIAQSLTLYSFKDLQSATNNFSPSLWIGGSVYRGTINYEQQQQREVAVKKTNRDVTKEIDVLNKINHVNITTLHGVCYNDGLWYLVYEYAPNGPLSNWIYQSMTGSENKTCTCLSWIQRVQITLDVATGLDYLHSYTSPPHVHKDLKCSRILLDGERRAKISHFGLSKSVGGQFALTEHIVGTKGYMAPEYLQNGLVTSKMDVYAFGILLVEILTGREVDLLYNGEGVYLSEVLEALGDGEGKIKAFMDPSLQDYYPIEVATAMVRLAQRCVRKEPSGRPGMDETVRLLSKALTSSLMRESISSQTTSSSAQ